MVVVSTRNGVGERERGETRRRPLRRPWELPIGVCAAGSQPVKVGPTPRETAINFFWGAIREVGGSAGRETPPLLVWKVTAVQIRRWCYKNGVALRNLASW